MKTVIELDCGDMPPGCEFACGACIQELSEVIMALDGVTGFSQRLDNHIEVEHEPEAVSQQDLLDAIARLPSEQDGFFTPTIVAG